jgi:hypothetical protein
MTTLSTCSYRLYREEMGQAVVISLSLPRGQLRTEAAKWPRLREATPQRDYLDADAAEFERRYLAQLDRYGPARIGAALELIARERRGQTLVLCCFEPVPADCHRSTFAGWLTATTGELVAEAL